jgi:hypothetical protein
LSEAIAPGASASIATTTERAGLSAGRGRADRSDRCTSPF